MRKVALLLLIAILGSGYVFGIANAQSQTLPQEAVVSYASNIIVNVDNSIDVTETITYNTGPQEHHGIYRDIYPYSSQNRKMAISICLTPKFGQYGKIEKRHKTYATHKKISVPGFKSKSRFGAHSRNRNDSSDLLQV